MLAFATYGTCALQLNDGHTHCLHQGEADLCITLHHCHQQTIIQVDTGQCGSTIVISRQSFRWKLTSVGLPLSPADSHSDGNWPLYVYHCHQQTIIQVDTGRCMSTIVTSRQSFRRKLAAVCLPLSPADNHSDGNWPLYVYHCH